MDDKELVALRDEVRVLRNIASAANDAVLGLEMGATSSVRDHLKRALAELETLDGGDDA